MILQVFYSIFSGILFSLAIPNEILLFGCPYLTLFAFIPLYLAFSQSKSYREAFWLGFIQTITTHLLSSFWLAYFKDFAIFTLGASAVGTGFIGAFFGLLFFLPFSDSEGRNKLNQKSIFTKICFLKSQTFKILYFAGVYTLYEWIKSIGFLGYPWGTVCSATYKWRLLAQVTSITGTYGITFLILLFNAIAAQAFIIWTCKGGLSNVTLAKIPRYFSEIKVPAVLWAVLLIPTLIYGLFQYNRTRLPVKSLTTILVQQNSDPWKSESDNDNILLSERLAQEQIDQALNNGRTPQLVVFSEGVLQRVFPNSESHYRSHPWENPLSTFVKENKIPLLTGGSYLKTWETSEEDQTQRHDDLSSASTSGLSKIEKKYYNAALVFDKNGNFRGAYGKNHLVPFAEALPFTEIPLFKAFFEKVIGISAGWAPGDQYVFFEIPCSAEKNYKLPPVKTYDLTKSYSQHLQDEKENPTVKFAAPICFDDAFPDIMRPLFLNGAELFINITDDSWSLKKSSEIQHFVIASYRAIEYRTTLVRCANAGYSVVVTPAGKVIDDLPLFEEAALETRVPIYEHKMTTYAKFGNWLPGLLCLLALAYIAYRILTFQKTDFLPSERRPFKKSKKHKKNSKNKK